MGLESSVVIFGMVSEAQKRELIQGAKVFLMPSHFESFPITLLESLASGTPAVAFDLPCLTGPFESGILKVRCFDVAEFAAQVVRVIGSDRLRQAMSDSAIQGAAQYTWDYSVSRFAEALGALNEVE
jgi:glycosyltransferase involved in cell wall biosynthesis